MNTSSLPHMEEKKNNSAKTTAAKSPSPSIYAEEATTGLINDGISKHKDTTAHALCFARVCCAYSFLPNASIRLFNSYASKCNCWLGPDCRLLSFALVLCDYDFILIELRFSPPVYLRWKEPISSGVVP